MSRRIRSPDPLSAAYSEDGSSTYEDSEREHEHLFTHSTHRHRRYYYDVDDSEDDGLLDVREPLRPRRSPSRNVFRHSSRLSSGEDNDFLERGSEEEDRILERVAREEARRELEGEREKDETYFHYQGYDSPSYWQRDRESDEAIANGDDLPAHEFVSQQGDLPRSQYYDDVPEDDQEMARPRRKHRRVRPAELDELEEEADQKQTPLQRRMDSSSSSTEENGEDFRYHRLHRHRSFSGEVPGEGIPLPRREGSSSRKTDRAGRVMGIYKHQYSSSPREEVYEVIIRHHKKGRSRPGSEREKGKDISAGRPARRGVKDDLEEIIVCIDDSRRNRSRLRNDRENVDPRNIGGVKESHLPSAETKEEEVTIPRHASDLREVKEEKIILEERRPSVSHAGNPEGKRKPIFTEVSKDLIVRKAIERAGYEYEEKSDFYRIFEFLRHVCLVDAMLQIPGCGC